MLQYVARAGKAQHNTCAHLTLEHMTYIRILIECIIVAECQTYNALCPCAFFYLLFESNEDNECLFVQVDIVLF